jgi:hypothetical protein
MPKIVDSETYLSTKEAAELFGVSKQTFYSNARPHLRLYHFDGKMTPWYSKTEVEALATGKPIRKASIAITGMFSDWTEHARSLGFNVQTTDRETTVGPLPQDIAEAFHATTDQMFVKRSRMSWVERRPICLWDSYYAVEHVNDILPQIQNGTAHDIVEHVAKKGIIVNDVMDYYSTRITTFEEQAQFQLMNAEPLLILQRMARTDDQKTLVFFQNMQLLGSWFVISRHEKVHHWDR